MRRHRPREAIRARALWQAGLSALLGIGTTTAAVAGAATASVWIPTGLILGACATSVYYNLKRAGYPVPPATPSYGLRTHTQTATIDTRDVNPAMVNTDNIMYVDPELLAHLRLYVVFRRRDLSCLHYLRGRALVWYKENNISAQMAAVTLPGTVASAFALSPEELAAMRYLQSNEVQFAVEQTSMLEAGRPFNTDAASLARWWYGECSLQDVFTKWAESWARPARGIPAT